MRKILYVMALLLLGVHTAMAQDATSVLDKTASVLKAAGNVKIGFTLEVEGGSSVGYIKLQGQKFVVNMGGTITWFDGKTMWTYVKKNEEVNVTTPSAAELAKINPYAFLTFYKKGYTAKMNNSTAKEYEVLLVGGASSPYSQVMLHINKATHYPASIMMTSAKGGVTTIRCNSFLKNQKYTDATFRFSKKNYPKVEVVDLR